MRMNRGDELVTISKRDLRRLCFSSTEYYIDILDNDDDPEIEEIATRRLRDIATLRKLATG